MSKDPQIVGYARAIFEIARTEGELMKLADELFRIARTVESQHQLSQALTDIALPLEAKERLLDEVLGKRVSSHTLNVIRFVVSQGKARQLVAIADELARIAEDESKREIAEIRTALPLDESQTKKLGEALSAATGKNVSVKVIVDPSVIGGVLARVGDVVIDGTVKHKLELLKEHLGVH